MLGRSAPGEGGAAGSSQIASREAANVAMSIPNAIGRLKTAIRTPAIVGPVTRASVETTSSTAIAASSWSSGTSRGVSAFRAGRWKQ
jgi:hypothetical protein